MRSDTWQEKIHGFLDPADDKPEHFAAIGRLITAFNGIDVILNMILRHQINADTKIGRAIIGGMRTDDMLSSIKRVANLTRLDEERLAQLDELHQDIRAFKDIRDNLAHRVWAVRNEEMCFTNYYTGRRMDVADFEIYTIAELNELARYAPHLSERALKLFPEATPQGDDYKFTPRAKPARLHAKSKAPYAG
jgi:hypothetical protein